MSKIKIGVQVTAKVRHTNVTVSGTFQGYELEDQEDPTSGCGKVLYVKDGMMHLDRVYIDSIKVYENKNETMRKRIINILTNNTDAHEEGAALYAEEIAWLKEQKEQKPVKLNDDTEVGLDRALQIVKAAKGNLHGYQSDDGIYECCHAIQTLERILKNGIEQQPDADLEKASQHVYESWNGGTMDDVRRGMVELGKVLNARKK